jgi:hypothetical protein
MEGSMTPSATISAVAHVIQLAVAPVFLLTGIAAILGVLTNRLGRVVDRFRELEGLNCENSANRKNVHFTEMKILSRRAKWIHWAISLCTIAALLVCVVIAALFIGSSLDVELPGTITSLFILAMISLITGLLCFLREIWLATSNIHIGSR